MTDYRVEKGTMFNKTVFLVVRVSDNHTIGYRVTRAQANEYARQLNNRKD